MKYSLTCYGHENITAKHKTTLEFTKDEELRLEGDCIIGVKSDFSLGSLKDFINKKDLYKNKKITITIRTINDNKTKNDAKTKKPIEEKITAEINPKFNSHDEIVIRKTDFVSERTLATKADKAASDLNRNLIDYLRYRESKITVVFEF